MTLSPYVLAQQLFGAILWLIGKHRNSVVFNKDVFDRLKYLLALTCLLWNSSKDLLNLFRING